LALSAALASRWIQPEPISVSPSEIHFGVVDEGTSKQVLVTLENNTAHDLVIMGARTSCTCLRVRELPVRILPEARQTLSITVTPPAAEQFSGRVAFYTNASRHLYPVIKYQGIRGNPIAQTKLHAAPNE
jgi:hypothetical protein